MMEEKTKEKLIEGINSYISNGYVDAKSFNDPFNEVVDYLNALISVDSNAAEECCKAVINERNIDSFIFKAMCLNDLLLSQDEWSYAFDYLMNKTENISIPELEKSLFYFYCAKNEVDPHPVPDGLFKKLIERYQMVKDESDADFYHLHETYNDFVKAYSLGS